MSPSELKMGVAYIINPDHPTTKRFPDFYGPAAQRKRRFWVGEPPRPPPNRPTRAYSDRRMAGGGPGAGSMWRK